MIITELCGAVDKTAMMSQIDQGKTVALKRCYACGAELKERDRFCRRCGVNLDRGVTSLIVGDSQSASIRRASIAPSLSPDVTSALTEADVYCPDPSLLTKAVAALTKAVAAGVLTSPLSRWDSPAARMMILVFISIPIWLVIVLLSPLDAYTAARAALQRVGCK